MRITTCVLLAFSLVLFGATLGHGQDPTSAQAGPYQLRQTFHVGGTGGWDYLTVDPEHGLLYVPRTTHTMVLDAATGKTVADIPGQKRNHGVAIVASVGRGFISDGEDGSVTIFDLKTYQVLGKVKADKDADGIIYDPVSRKVLVSCGDAGVLIPISADVDPKTGNGRPARRLGRQARIPRRRRGQSLRQSRGQGSGRCRGYQTMKVIHKWPTAPGGSPVGMSMDVSRHRLFVGCRKPQKLIVMSSDDGKVLADLPIGAGVDATQFDGDAFASCRDGTLAVARETSPGKFAIIQTVSTRPGARTMGLDPRTHTLYLPTAEFGQQKDAKSRPIPKAGTFMILVVGLSSR